MAVDNIGNSNVQAIQGRAAAAEKRRAEQQSLDASIQAQQVRQDVAQMKQAQQVQQSAPTSARGQQIDIYV